MEIQELTVLKIEDLRPFPGNPFHLVEDEQLMELSESIKEQADKPLYRGLADAKALCHDFIRPGLRTNLGQC